MIKRSYLILVIVFGGILAVIKLNPPEIDDSPEIKTYNGFVFEKEGNIWKTNFVVEDKFKGWKRTYLLLFHYTPDEVENITTMRNSKGETISPNLFLNVNKVYITTDPDYPAEVILGAVEISKIVGQIYEKDVKGATTRQDNRTDAPVITCEDISSSARVIRLDIGDQTRIYSDKGCVIVEGTNPSEVVRASERLAYEMLKIL